MKAIVDEEAYKILLEIHKSNYINGGHYTVFGCCCEPSCYIKYGITEEKLKSYNKRMDKDWALFMSEHSKETIYKKFKEEQK
jgi:hypothetical protein